MRSICLLVLSWISLCTSLAFSGERVSASKESPTTQPKSMLVQISKDITLRFLELKVGTNRIWLGKTPITEGQYAVAVLQSVVGCPMTPKKDAFKFGPKGWLKKFEWKDGKPPEREGKAAILFVNKKEATRYCHWLSARSDKFRFRLPTTEEWLAMGETLNLKETRKCTTGTVSVFFSPRMVDEKNAIIMKGGFRVGRFTCELLSITKIFIPEKYREEYKKYMHLFEVPADIAIVRYLNNGGKPERGRLSDEQRYLVQQRGYGNFLPVPATFRLVAEGLGPILREFRAGKGVRIGAIGVKSGRKLIKELAIDYVKAKAVIQMRYAPTDEMSAVGYFLADRKGSNMELLLLNGKPSRRAMKIHGKKWEALKPKEHLIAGRGVAIVVHSLNKLESLTLEQVRAVFAGKVKDWKILAGGAGGGIRPEKAAPLEIHRFGLHQPDLTADMFYDRVLGSHLCGRLNRKKGTAAVLAALSIDPQGIAFVNFADLPAYPDKSSIKVLSVGPAGKAVQPTSETILDGSYPLSQRLHLYVSPKACEVTKDFVKFVLSGVCGETFGRHGLAR